MKECGKCKQEKPFSEFAKSSARKDGLQLQCKTCKVKQNREKGYNKKHYSNPENRKKQIQATTRWAKQNPDKIYEAVKRYKFKDLDKWNKMQNNYTSSLSPGVYAIKCLANGKMYIGESKYPMKRKGHHMAVAKSEKTLSSTNPFLQEDIQKYGVNSFIFGIIEETPNHKEREKYWINYYNPEYNERFI